MVRAEELPLQLVEFLHAAGVAALFKGGEQPSVQDAPDQLITQQISRKT
jgi:hypothetical protein